MPTFSKEELERKTLSPHAEMCKAIEAYIEKAIFNPAFQGLQEKNKSLEKEDQTKLEGDAVNARKIRVSVFQDDLYSTLFAVYYHGIYQHSAAFDIVATQSEIGNDPPAEERCGDYYCGPGEIHFLVRVPKVVELEKDLSLWKERLGSEMHTILYVSERCSNGTGIFPVPKILAYHIDTRGDLFFQPVNTAEDCHLQMPKLLNLENVYQPGYLLMRLPPQCHVKLKDDGVYVKTLADNWGERRSTIAQLKSRCKVPECEHEDVIGKDMDDRESVIDQVIFFTRQLFTFTLNKGTIPQSLPMLSGDAYRYHLDPFRAGKRKKTYNESFKLGEGKGPAETSHPPKLVSHKYLSFANRSISQILAAVGNAERSSSSLRLQYRFLEDFKTWLLLRAFLLYQDAEFFVNLKPEDPKYEEYKDIAEPMKAYSASLQKFLSSEVLETEKGVDGSETISLNPALRFSRASKKFEEIGNPDFELDVRIKAQTALHANDNSTAEQSERTEEFANAENCYQSFLRHNSIGDPANLILRVIKPHEDEERNTQDQKCPSPDPTQVGCVLGWESATRVPYWACLQLLEFVTMDKWLKVSEERGENLNDRSEDLREFALRMVYQKFNPQDPSINLEATLPEKKGNLSLSYILEDTICRQLISLELVTSSFASTMLLGRSGDAVNAASKYVDDWFLKKMLDKFKEDPELLENEHTEAPAGSS